MNILLCAATSMEMEGTRQFLLTNATQLSSNRFLIGNLTVTLLVTGIGSAITGYVLGKYLGQSSKPDFAFQIGIAGTFNPDWPLSDVYLVAEDQFADLGAENANGEFSNLFQMNFLQLDDFPFSAGKLISGDYEHLRHLPKASSITINNVSGQKSTIQQRSINFKADLESMEGAIFAYACSTESIAYAQIRSISNYVEIRDKSKWQIKSAIESLTTTMSNTITELAAKA
ncbi:MAG: hypothetical protein ABIV51_10185 [Saprospiraceae bacterium]